MNVFYIGFKREVELPRGAFLYINDEVPELPDWRRPKYFEPGKHSFNPLAGIDHIKARDLAKVVYALYPQGESTLTVRNGRRAMPKALLKAKKLDGAEGDEEVSGAISDLLFTPLMRNVLCEKSNFKFTNSPILARINRAELGEDDALALGLLLMAEWKGQIVLPDGGFYLRDIHANLIREGRLSAGCTILDELPEKLRQRLLLVPDKVGQGTTVKDAATLATYMCKFPPGTDGYDTFVKGLVN